MGRFKADAYMSVMDNQNLLSTQHDTEVELEKLFVEVPILKGPTSVQEGP